MKQSMHRKFIIKWNLGDSGIAANLEAQVLMVVRRIEPRQLVLHTPVYMY